VPALAASQRAGLDADTLAFADLVAVVEARLAEVRDDPVALVVLGASDAVSVVIRFSLLQNETPDEMRGRVTAVDMIFIGTSNEFGQFESGLTAQWFGTVPAVVLGGIGTLVVIGLWAWLFPELRRASAVRPMHLRP